MNIKISCPFCEAEMKRAERQPVPGIKIYRCEICSSEFRQQLVQSPVEPSAPEPEKEGCGACFSSDTPCSNCGDGVCEQHQQTWRSFSGHLSKNMLHDFEIEDLDEIYCPVCFPIILNRKSMKIRRRKKPDSAFKNPWTLFLLIAVLALSYVAKKCG
ncbi:MAG: hypothetical protein CSA81_01225 [Acidobacteria bacterium]|nr:MAG: hypothetical protein CSA81_01225 [Acidobacteriota bacterium]